MFRNMIRFYGEELLASHPTPKLEDHPLSAVRYCLLNVFAATVRIGGRSPNRNLRTRHAMMTGTHLSRDSFVFTTSNSPLVMLLSERITERSGVWYGELYIAHNFLVNPILAFISSRNVSANDGQNN